MDLCLLLSQELIAERILTELTGPTFCSVRLASSSVRDIVDVKHLCYAYRGENQQSGAELSKAKLRDSKHIWS